jgi:hypothetical protein
MPDIDSQGISLIEQDAIAHGDIDRWLVDDQDGQTDDLFSIPPDDDDISGNGTINPFLLSSITGSQNIVYLYPLRHDPRHRTGKPSLTRKRLVATRQKVSELGLPARLVRRSDWRRVQRVNTKALT